MTEPQVHSNQSGNEQFPGEAPFLPAEDHLGFAGRGNTSTGGLRMVKEKRQEGNTHLFEMHGIDKTGKKGNMLEIIYTRKK